MLLQVSVVRFIASRFLVTSSGATITGQGFMALAAMIFGKWHPLGALGAALFFGFAQSLSITGGTIPVLKEIPSVFLTYYLMYLQY